MSESILAGKLPAEVKLELRDIEHLERAFANNSTDARPQVYSALLALARRALEAEKPPTGEVTREHREAAIVVCGGPGPCCKKWALDGEFEKSLHERPRLVAQLLATRGRQAYQRGRAEAQAELAAAISALVSAIRLPAYHPQRDSLSWLAGRVVGELDELRRQMAQGGWVAVTPENEELFEALGRAADELERAQKGGGR